MDKDNNDKFAKNVEAKASRKLKLLRKPGRSVWMGLGTMGIVGWSVTVPTLLGLVLGFWLDKHYVSTVSWTLNLLIVGLLIGCLSAWHWVSKEDSDMHKDEDASDD